MPDKTLPDQIWPETERRSALAGVYKTGTFGADPPGVILAERRNLSILHVAGPVECESVLTTRQTSATVLWLAPDRWLVVSVGPDSGAFEGQVCSALDTLSAAVNDVSHGRTVIRVTGAQSRLLLAKGCSVDLHPRAFTPGRCAQTNMAGINVLLHALDGEDGFDVYVARGFALSLWEWMTDGAGEFGYIVGDLLQS